MSNDSENPQVDQGRKAGAWNVQHVTNKTVEAGAEGCQVVTRSEHVASPLNGSEQS